MKRSLPCLLLLLPAVSMAHDMTDVARERMADGGFLNVMWTGAEHMLSGYDHLLFLLGVMFFLTRFVDILKFVTAFTLGHTLTLTFATYAGITANHYLIDAVIAATVIYKGFENLDGFRRWFGKPAPNLLLMVFLFGLIHGFGLSARLQEVTLADDPALMGKILIFNLGVEAGQIAALLVMAVAIRSWQQVRQWPHISRLCNVGLMLAGAGLLVFQLSGYYQERQQSLAAMRFAVFSDTEQVMGQVLDNQNHNGLPSVTLSIEEQAGQGQALEATTDAQGWFTFRGKPGSQYVIRAQDSDGNTASTTVDLGSAAPAHEHERHIPVYLIIAAVLALSLLPAHQLRQRQPSMPAA